MPQTKEGTEDSGPTNRAARRAATKQEAKEAKVAQVSKSVKTKKKAVPSTSASKELNPKTTTKEFGGVPGAIAFITVLPALVLTFAYGCNKELGYHPFYRLYTFITNFDVNVIVNTLKNWHYGTGILYIVFILQLVVFSVSLPGPEVEGVPLRDGTKLKYKTNALMVLQSVSTLVFMALRGQGTFMFVWIRDNFADLVLFSIFFAYVISIAVYAGSFIGNQMLALGGNTGNPIYDFMIGRPLNPRIGSFDLKFFSELRPGLMLWAGLNLTFAIVQYVELGRITYSMILTVAFQIWYVVDSLINESSVLTTMDITTDGLGFMLLFGNYSWVPMMYSLQARYLADNPVDLSYPAIIGIIALQLIGYWIFRSANAQKDTFRKKPLSFPVKDLTYIQTKTGSKLITSGWWGKSRHINYFGDWLMSLAWCLPCGFNSIIPYFYCIYFAILLIHRERRDNHKCQTKYGEDWDRYCSIVKYRIIPYIY
ncbi:ergosterol biosynthesis ERG4/ERG24 [Pilobolus umbonatus]|nr:ergosterol biosynthesis ERG4/ERG24 [Pilobolus umbonatus]